MRSSSGGVYQPTTTNINDHHTAGKSWSSGPRFLGPAGTTMGGRSWTKSLVLPLAGLFGLMGLIMVIVGGKWHHDMSAAAASTAAAVAANATAINAGDGAPAASATPYVTVLLVGLLLMVVALLSLLAYHRSQGASLPCCPGKIANIRQRLHPQTKMSGPMSAQYCPPTAAPASPSSLSSSASPASSPAAVPPPEPPFADVSEQQRLMSDESDRCAEEDPRIVLSPLRPCDC